ncbi:hypothetical protein [Fibrobacter sp.]|uniref:hypothetical protein n=1 Tax=Fibrobacter sp. TaxID=35828 RepID=UPI00389045A2
MLFALFPLTDTDIWWHLACAREWVTTWTPVRTPVVNVHEYFQVVVAFVYGVGGAPLLVAFKAVLWGAVFALFVRGVRHGELPKNVIASPVGAWQSLVAILLIFIFRYHFEIRPVLFTLLFLGIYWKILPSILAIRYCELLSRACHERSVEAAISRSRLVLEMVLVFAIQWLWCKCQGLYILGPLFALLVLVAFIRESRRAGEKLSLKAVAWRVAFVLVLFAMPFLHREGLSLFLYPFGLLDRLLGLTPSAAVFASQIAENRSPFTLLLAGENTLECALMILLCIAGMGFAMWRLFQDRRPDVLNVSLLVTAILALVAERNFVLFLPVLFGSFYSKCNLGFHSSLLSVKNDCSKKTLLITNHCLLPTVYFLLPTFFILGLWARSLSAYDYSMVSYQRVPVDAANWMRQNPHAGRLFNDDRAGGYLAFVNPADSIYMDGRFILKTADFFERYLEYAKNPSQFLADADSLNIDRALFPLRYYARWDSLLQALETAPRWHLAYRDDYFVVFDKF